MHILGDRFKLSNILIYNIDDIYKYIKKLEGQRRSLYIYNLLYMQKDAARTYSLLYNQKKKNTIVIILSIIVARLTSNYKVLILFLNAKAAPLEKDAKIY